jgi:hypothetical protein
LGWSRERNGRSEEVERRKEETEQILTKEGTERQEKLGTEQLKMLEYCQ